MPINVQLDCKKIVPYVFYNGILTIIIDPDILCPLLWYVYAYFKANYVQSKSTPNTMLYNNNSPIMTISITILNISK